MKTAILAGLGLLLPVVLCAPGVAEADVVALRTVPSAKLPKELDLPRSAAPEHIPATERVEGFYAVGPTADTMKRLKEHGGYRYVQLYGTEAQAKANSASEREAAAPAVSACFSTGWSRYASLSLSSYIAAPPPKPGSKEWLAEQKKKAAAVLAAAKAHRTITPPPPPTKPITVRPIRSERFTVGADGGGTLEVVDVWLDTESLGTRVASRATVPFARVAAGPSSLEIYAAREDKLVSFLVTSPKAPAAEAVNGVTPPIPSGLRSLANRVSAESPNGASSSSSECGYTRLALVAAPGSGQMASVLANAFLAPAPDDANDLPADSSSEDEEERRPGSAGPRLVRSRPFLTNLSISQLVTEPDPTLSISFAWGGPDEQHRF